MFLVFSLRNKVDRRSSTTWNEFVHLLVLIVGQTINSTDHRTQVVVILNANDINRWFRSTRKRQRLTYARRFDFAFVRLIVIEDRLELFMFT